MKKLLPAFIAFFAFTVTYGQLYPVKNLKYGSHYEYQNPTCPQYNCFSLTWTQPDSSFKDTLVGYNVYRNAVLYTSVPVNQSALECRGYNPSAICTFPGTWFNKMPFWITVKAVYDKDSVTSIAKDSILIKGFTIGINELSSKKYFTVSPNPFCLQTTLQTDQPFEGVTLTVYNWVGEQVKQIRNISGQSIIFHRDRLPAGLYFIRLMQYDKVIATDKFVIADN